LTAIGRRLRSLAGDAAPDAALRAEELGRLADAAIAEADEVRRLSRNLRPSVLDHLGLEAALGLLLEELQAAGVLASLAVTGDAALLGDATRTALFRIAQEAVTNIRRHSGAQTTSMQLRVGEHEVRFEVRDDGCGFDAPALESERRRSARLGLAGMRERALMLGGTVRIHSAVGDGTTVEASLPLID
jgi:signal transduction histidine kinase